MSDQQPLESARQTVYGDERALPDAQKYLRDKEASLKKLKGP